MAGTNWLGADADKKAVGVPVPVGTMKLFSKNGGSLELITRNGEPAVVVDGKHIIRHGTLVRQLAENNNG